MKDSTGLLGYRAFLEVRDGKPDSYRDRLPEREAFYREIETHPVRSCRVFDRDTFLRNARRAVPERGLGDHMLWLLFTARANQAERFGVELGKLYGRVPPEDQDPEFVHVLLQETYHTRTLADVVGMFGLPVPQCAPPFFIRSLIKAMVFNPLPERLGLPLVGGSEMMGCVTFRALRDRGLELFADEPEVAARIGLLFDEILADEICHVGLVEARLGRIGRAAMRFVFRQMASHIGATLAGEYARVLDAERFAEAARTPFDQGALAAEFPEKAYAF
jgi:hypothetical protein